MRERRWPLLALYGLLLATAVAGALKATRPKFKIATTSTTTTEEPDVANNEDGENETTTSLNDGNGTTSRVLTGIPQIDYIWDPNLPRELNGYNLSEYPFYNSIPEDIDFKCDGLHDGFYASVPHKCQVYHHCLFGTRFDFLCANFTAFDQKTFICHFVSMVDCANSKKHWHRNDALYKTAETTTLSTTSTSTASTTTTSTTSVAPASGRGASRRRRPFRRRPAYDYYEEEYYDDEAAYERTRPRGGYDRRDDYDYDDRKYSRRDRDRDRNFRDRDYRDREPPRSRDPVDRPMRGEAVVERPLKDDREVPLSPRERFPSRNNRRDPMRPGQSIPPRDPIFDEENPRIRSRDQDPPVRSREPEDMPPAAHDDRRSSDSRIRDVDERPRYADKGYSEDYEDELAAPATSTASSDILVKPAAPSSSVYARPRAAPKIRRPVPITEQEKFAYKATPAPQPTAVEARRRPVETAPLEDDYYDEELEEVRPRRPATRRRPGFRDFYDNPRERDRPFRSRYREDGDEGRTRKHQERNRERYYERGPERGRDRALDRSKDRGSERAGGSRTQESDRASAGRPGDRESDRPRGSPRPKDPPETTKRPHIYDRTSVAPTTISTISEEGFKDELTNKNTSERAERPSKPSSGLGQDQSPVAKDPTIKPELPSARVPENENVDDDDDDDNDNKRIEADKEDSTRYKNASPLRDETPGKDSKPKNEGTEEYSSVEEYYDEPEYQPSPQPPPRTAVRIVKRPFLPSRGGNPNPRGLLPVGSKAPESSRKEEPAVHRPAPNRSSGRSHPEVYRNPEHEEKYKFIPMDDGEKTRAEDYEQVVQRPATKRPLDTGRNQLSTSGHLAIDKNHRDPQSSRLPTGHDSKNPSPHGPLRDEASNRGRDPEDEEIEREKPTVKWNREEYRPPSRGDTRYEQPAHENENSGYYGDTLYTNENNESEQEPILQSGNVAANKPTLNEVVTTHQHRLQDIPESEYDVTLNEALTPSFNSQDSNLPSGFVLPVHRQFGRDPILQSTENSYKVSRPFNQPITAAQSQQQQQKTFVASPQFLPIAGIANGNERSRSVQYFRTPEAVHVTSTQYRHQRGPWHDYTGY